MYLPTKFVIGKLVLALQKHSGVGCASWEKLERQMDFSPLSA